MKTLVLIYALILVTAATDGEVPAATPSPSNTEQVCANNNKVYTVCGSACPLTCENMDDPPSCIQECVAGCFCPNGMVSNQGTCVQPQDCPSTTTTQNFNTPYVTPPIVCPEIADSEALGACVIVSECSNQELGSTGGCGEDRMCCSNGCGIVCKEGVNPSPLCPAVKAKAMNESSGLLGAYVPQCEEDGTFSHVQCHEGMCWCVDCKTGKAKSEPVGPGTLPECATAATAAPAVPSPSASPSTPACTSGKVYSSCGTMCPLTCENKDSPPVPCPLACVVGCVCPSGMAEYNGGCVKPKNCPTNTTGGKPAYCHLPPVSGLCEAYMPSFFFNATSKQCESFVYGGCGGNDNRFQTKESCMESCGDQVSAATPSPTSPPEPACTNSKVYTSCGTMCPLTCDNKDNPPQICPLACKIGCVCSSGMVEYNGGCVKPENCPTTTATPTPVPASAGYAVEATYNAQKLCPFVSEGTVGTCSEACSSDGDCEDWEKCCSNGCGRLCRDTISVPYYSPPLTCPETAFPVCNFHFACASHDECEEEKLCCSTGCGALCMEAIRPSPICPAVRNSTLSSGLLGAYIPQCEKDGTFSPVQCHASTGQCWCVDTETGKPLSVPLLAQQPECDSTVTDICAAIMCDWPNCGEDVQPIMDDEHCCPYCPASCTVGDQTYPSGSSYKSSDGCNTCSCYNGLSACTEMACISVCKAGGVEMAEGETRNDGCSECTCANSKIACTMSGECVNPIKRSLNIKMKFSGDFDVVSQDLEGFKLHFKTTLVTKYQAFNLQESQIIDINVYQGSIVVQITMEDPDEDEDGGLTESANITLVVIQLEQDYNNNDLAIEYQDTTLEPSGEFSYEDSDSEEDDEFFFWSYIGISVALIISIILLIIAVIGVAILYKKNRRTAKMTPVPTTDEDDDVCNTRMKGFINPTYVKI